MWQRTASWLLVVGSALPVMAEDGSSLPSSLRTFPLLSGDARLRFHVVSGRLAIRTVHLGTKSRQTLEQDGDGCRERLTFVAGDLSVSLHGTKTSSDGALSIDVDQPCRLRLHCRFERDGVERSITYEQSSDHVVRMSISLPEGTTLYSAPSIWHLCFEYPDMSDRYLLPLVGAYGRGWDLGKRCRVIRRSMLKIAHRTQPPDRRELATLVRQLGSPQRRVRQTAFRRLRSIGYPVLAYLEEISVEQLDREQRMQLHRLRRVLSDIDYDTPERVAMRLAAEPRVWTALSRSADLEVKAIAARQLQRLSGDAPVEDYAAAP